MGGGVGVGAHGSVRVVTDTTKMAMPEVGIGFIPDVGGTYLLSRAPGLLGLHAALTGAPFTGADAIAMGFADHFVPHDALGAFTAGRRRRRHRRRPGRARRRATAESASGATALDRRVLRRRDRRRHRRRAARPRRGARQRRRQPDRHPLPHRAGRHAGGHPPRRQARHAGRRSAPGVSDVVRVVRVSTTSSRASAPMVIDKDRNPKWSPATLAAVTTADVEAYFAPADRELEFSDSTSYETILVTRDDRVGTITLNRPKALNALNSQVMDEVTTAAAEFDDDPGHRRDHHHRQREGLRGGRGHQGDGRPVVRRRVRLRLLRAMGQVRRHPHTDHRRGRRLRARRRLRAGDDVRPADRRRHREVRPARDQARRAARHGRLAAADPRRSARPRRWT